MRYFAHTDFDQVVPGTLAASGVSWPSSLVVPPNNYAIDGVYIDMNYEGVHFISYSYQGGYDGGQRIVYNGDVPRLMSSLAWVSRYGREDEALTDAQKTTKARERSLGMRCGPTINWVKSILDAQGVTSRVVRLLTANTAPDSVDPMFVPYADGLDEGHVAIEVMLPTGWALFDVPGDVAFTDSNGKFMSLAEVIDAGVDNCDVFRLAPTDSYPTSWSSTQWNTEVYFNIRLREYAHLWRRGIYQIPGIDSGGNTYFTMPTGTESRQSWVSGLSGTYQVVGRQVWDSMFY